MTTTPLDLDAIHARCEKATPGPWFCEPEHQRDTRPADTYDVLGPEGYLAANQEHPDADFIAHARTDVPALLDEIKRLRELNARAQALLDGYLPEMQAVEAERAALAAKVARVESLAELDSDSIWLKRDTKIVRVTARQPSGCKVTESMVRVDDLAAALAGES